MRVQRFLCLAMVATLLACGDDETTTGGGGSGAEGGQGAQGGVGAQGGQGGGECSVAEDCPEPANECQQRGCDQGLCNVTPVAAGTAVADQTAGDCHVAQCDGAGGVVLVVDDGDLPDDNNPCTVGSCNGGLPAHDPAAAGTPCGVSTVCDGAGQCVGCVEPEDCPGDDDECQARSCTAGVCGMDFTPAGTKLSTQTLGDCSVAVCDGAGGPTDEVDDLDVPPDTDCASGACDNGTPDLTPEAAGTSCTESGGQVCDGAGICVECIGDAQCGGGTCVSNACAPLVVATTPADGAIDVVADVSIVIEFSEAMDPATLTAQTSAGACTGSIQLSYNGFASCVPFTAAAPVMSAGDTVATLSPDPALAHGVGYALKVTTAATDTDGVALGLEHQGTFVVVAPSPCAGNVVISQIYGGGGNAGAQFTHDFVELHNAGKTVAALDGWSIQYASNTGLNWNTTTALTGAIPPGGYFLVQMAGGANGVALPSPDLVGTVAMAATAGKVALVSQLGGLSGACPTGPEIVDFVGFGTTANCFEGTAPTASLSNTTAAHRAVSGCLDGNDNVDDFSVAAPMPRNSQSALALCSCPDDVVLNESDLPDEADYCNLQFPTTFSVVRFATTADVFGRIFEAGVTEAAGPPPGILAQLGYARTGAAVSASGWAWFDASYNVQVGNDDEFMASFVAPAALGTYQYTYRFSNDGGESFTYCDLDGAGSNPGLAFDPALLGVMTVTP
jgi:hypothetical protein